VSAGNEAVRYERPASTRLFLAVAASAVFVSVLTATMINVLGRFRYRRYRTSWKRLYENSRQPQTESLQGAKTGQNGPVLTALHH
jgi:hypothetical protein